MASTTTQDEKTDLANIDLEISRQATIDEDLPFPWCQMVVLSAIRLVEPIAFCSITTYSFKMVQEIRGDNNATFSAGLLVSIFAGAEALTAWIWGDISDCLGRKPCILIAMVGTVASSIMLGFSKTYGVAVAARFIGGCLNGNTAVIQTMLAELLRNPKHKMIAYSMPPLMWNIGSIAGAAIGGRFAQPAGTWPALKDTIWDHYPFLLPNILSAAAVVLSGVGAAMFLEETNTEERRSNRRRSSVFATIWNQVQAIFSRQLTYRRSSTDSNTPFLDDEKNEHEQTKVFTRPVLAWTLSLFLLSYHQMAFSAQLPPFFEDSPDSKHWSKGGLGKTLGQVSNIQMVQSVISIGLQSIMPLLGDRLSRWKSTFASLALAIVPYIIMPMIKNLPNPDVGVYVVLALQCLATTTNYPLVYRLLTDSCLSPEVLGRINGVAMSVCSAARTAGPPLVGVFYDKFGAVFCWWSMAVVAIIGFVQLFFCRRPPDTS